MALSLAAVLSVSAAVSLSAKKGAEEVKAGDANAVYLQPGVWSADSARFAAYFFGNGDTWVSMTVVPTDATTYKVSIPTGYTSVIFCRMDPATTENNWDNKWNQSNDLTITAGQRYSITGWGTDKSPGQWGAYDEPVVKDSYKYSINGATPVEMVDHDSSQVKSSTALSLHKGDTLTFTKNNAAYVVAPKDDSQLTKVWKNASDQLVAAEDFTEVIYLDFTSAKLWAGQFTPEQYYVVGDNNDWNIKTGALATATGDGAYKASITVSAGDGVQFIKTPTTGNQVDWYHPDATKLHTSTEVAMSVVGDNLVLADAGTYDIYYNPTTGYYSVEDPSWTLPYTIQVGTTTYPLTLNTGTEYETAAINLTYGQSVKVLKNGVADTTFNRKVIANNNLDASGNVIATVSGATIYIDINAKTLFVGGMDFGGYHVLVDNVYHKMTQNPDPLDPSYREFYSSSLSFAQGNVIRLVDTTGDNPAASGFAYLFDITNFSEAPDVEGSFEISAGHIVASKAVQSAVYLKLKSGADEIYFGDVTEDLALAIEYAQNFLKAIQGQKGGVCKQDGTTDITALDSAWTTQKTNYAALGGDVAELKAAIQQHLKDSRGSSNEDLAAFSDLYDVVLDRHATQLSTGYDFLGRNISGARYTGAAQIFNETNLPLILIIGVSVLAITSVGAVVYLKVRKHD